MERLVFSHHGECVVFQAVRLPFLRSSVSLAAVGNNYRYIYKNMVTLADVHFESWKNKQVHGYLSFFGDVTVLIFTHFII